MKKYLSFLAIVVVVLISFSCTNNHCKNVYNGIDTSKYFVSYEKEGVVFLIEREKKDSLFAQKFIKGRQIHPDEAVAMMGLRIAPDVNVGTGYLNNTVTRSVTFDMTFLSAVLAQYKSNGVQPDSLTIYFGEYPANGSRYDSRESVILVGVRNGDEIFDRLNADIHPVNIGTLCPPDCVPVGNMSDKNSGKIFMKYACERAGAPNGWQQ